MTYPKMKPCPTCRSDRYIAVYTYESGWSRVECDKCGDIFSCEIRKLDAIRAHNKAESTTAGMPPSPVTPADQTDAEKVEQ